MVQVVEHLPGKCEALTSTPVWQKKKKTSKTKTRILKHAEALREEQTY
jgi:hypothetical protein